MFCVSFAAPNDLATCLRIGQSVMLDNGAFSAWRKGEPLANWAGFYEWAAMCKRVPSCDFAVIPDVIDGTEADNDALLSESPLPKLFGAPVWHMHESLSRLERLAAAYPREPWVEHFEWLEPLFNERIAIAKGRMIVPTRPGLGLSLSDQARAWTRQTAEFGERP